MSTPETRQSLTTADSSASASAYQEQQSRLAADERAMQAGPDEHMATMADHMKGFMQQMQTMMKGQQAMQGPMGRHMKDMHQHMTSMTADMEHMMKALEQMQKDSAMAPGKP